MITKYEWKYQLEDIDKSELTPFNARLLSHPPQPESARISGSIKIKEIK